MHMRGFLDPQEIREVVETTLSCITGKMPRKIHAVTERGFVLKTKVVPFV